MEPWKEAGKPQNTSTILVCFNPREKPQSHSAEVIRVLHLKIVGQESYDTRELLTPRGAAVLSLLVDTRRGTSLSSFRERGANPRG